MHGSQSLAGAIGSFVCDLLARSGVGSITAYDPDIIRPGNMICHLADVESVGLSEACRGQAPH